MLSKILIFGYANLFMEFLFAQFIFLMNVKRRKLFWVRFAIFAAAGMFFYFLPALNWLDFNWSYTLVFAVVLGLGFLLYDAPWQMIVVCSTVGYALQHMAWNALQLFYEVCYPVEDNLSQAGALAYYFLFYIVFYAVAFFVMWKGKVFSNFNTFSLPTIIATLGILAISVILSEKVSDWNPILRIYTILSALFSILIVTEAFQLSNNQKQQIYLESQNKLLQSLIIEKANQQTLTKETIDLINVKAHDMKHQVEVLKQMSGTEQSNYIDEISKTVDLYNDIAQTGNEVLDIVLTQKSLLCTSKKIKFTYIVEGNSFKPFDSVDMTALFANIIDNSIEGVSQEPEEKKIIKLVAYTKGNFVCIHSENCCSQALKFKDGLPITTKKDKANHGFGVKSIKYISEKYHGNSTFTLKDGLFSVNVLLTIPETTI